MANFDDLLGPKLSELTRYQTEIYNQIKNASPFQKFLDRAYNPIIEPTYEVDVELSKAEYETLLELVKDHPELKRKIEASQYDDYE